MNLWKWNACKYVPKQRKKYEYLLHVLNDFNKKKLNHFWSVELLLNLILYALYTIYIVYIIYYNTVCNI